LKNRITLLLLAGVCLLCALGVVFVWVGPASDEPPGQPSPADGAPSEHASNTTSQPPDFDPDREAARIHRVGEIGASAAVLEDTHLPDLGEDAGQAPRDGSAATDDVIDPASLPMATKGREQGIDTTVDDDWTPGREAEQWFGPLQDAFEAARPLTPDLYNEILGDHRETTVDVFKRAGEIGDQEGAEKGLKFLDEYNAMVDAYKGEAYGEAPR
jgi:hypothetical protein